MKMIKNLKRHKKQVRKINVKTERAGNFLVNVDIIIFIPALEIRHISRIVMVINKNK